MNTAHLESLRDSYNRVADRYIELEVGNLAAEPWLRAALAAFAEQVIGRGPVLDVGCGPGTVSGHLAERGVEIRGIDLSPAMVAHARRRFPGLEFEVGSATDLHVADGSLAGILGWWSLFHLPRPELPAVLAGFARALAPGGIALFGFHVGTGEIQRTEAYRGVAVDWITHLWQPNELFSLLPAAGLALDTELRFPAVGGQHAQLVFSAHHV